MKLSQALSLVTLAAAASAAPICAETTVSWSTLGNGLGADQKPAYIQRFVIKGDIDFDRLAFNQFARRMRTVDPAFTLVEIVPGYYCIDSDKFRSGADSVVVDIETAGYLRSICYTPDGVHIVRDGKAAPVTYTRADITADPAQWISPGGEDVMPYGPQIFERNRGLAAAAADFYDVIPSYKSVKLTGGKAAPVTRVTTAAVPQGAPGAWRAVIDGGELRVEAAEADLPLAMRRLEALGLSDGRIAPAAVITDRPDFPYRGLMIDIARNYQTPAQLGRILRLMARYGLNVLHFHFADDEAWRLEIPGMPELTEVGGRRGYTTDETEFMAQLFTGDGNPDNPAGSSNGYFTRAEFIAMLRTADSLGITVVPEIESPGHARAAIRAMEKRLRVTGDDTYRLIDPADTSVYTSAQSFHDNVMNPAIPGPVRFMTYLGAELQKMYREAGLEIPAIHIGGDEVAKGAWTGSPIARRYMDERGITDERQLHLIYVRELLDEYNRLGIPVSGWQEIAVGHDDEYNEAVRPHVFSVNCWSTLGKQNSVTSQSARAGYPTVLSNVDHFYLDMCYSPHPYERGLSWGGYVDEFDALAGYPRSLCPVDEESFRNVIGVSGQVFAETMRSPEMIESFLLPKMLGLAERGWNCDSTYSDARFNAVINTREVPYWQSEGYNFHLRQPGIALTDGKVVMNTSYPGSLAPVIRYTTDGSEPTAASAVYTGPFDAAGMRQVRAATFIGDKRSVTSILYTDKQ